MKAIPAAKYEEFLVRYELVTGKKISHAPVCGSVNILVSFLQLDPYGALLRKGGDLSGNKCGERTDKTVCEGCSAA